MYSRKSVICVFLSLLWSVSGAYSEEILELSQDFVESYKNRITIEGQFLVDASHAQPNDPSEDGDLHAAVRSPVIGLQAVAEIQNAKDTPDAVSLMRNAVGDSNGLSFTGVWRIWPEHGGDRQHIQVDGPGQKWTGPGPTNPPHVFEVHPLTKLGSVSLLPNLHLIEGYQYKNPDDAFQRYEAAHFEIEPLANDRVRLHMRMVGYNYVEFLMRLNKRFHRDPDGEFVAAGIYDLNGELLVRDLRVGFVKGSAPDEKQQALQVGQCLHMVGIPRVDLALVSWRMNHRNDAQYPNVLNWSLPYEIIGVGIFDEPPRQCGED
ncbi:hypothetical protein EOA50_07710 [Mesorhizobium sp. M1A.F.Ca.IN.020.30.1.1]|uniref:hypothetical protein n=1 Tax=unclassified Mesorhizobium TaxID=325217 RepID=UPI000FD3D6A6|nr:MULTISPECIES: hypothetical protein [unclassified Mesorhizobium]RUV77917.1 hypothetical protein EOA50_07710 [Mesorhizobium sp. M1A.F.Ca.IN.020.30.1.1]RWG43308.1 MAG: hypothetical protein EOQ59_00335 [Mesorhizobium sp.]RWG70072.1 MAG: hypothetical protein EOQ66_14570 [Mesorhizobium sp.]TIM76604.1 MAG: hypothetical protein E5Y44_10760 [Mesorhizobium sp.]TIM93207.1 MAG: hypothetical protein E5Y43_00480 [Mesorhizobium sp.]